MYIAVPEGTCQGSDATFQRAWRDSGRDPLLSRRKKESEPGESACQISSQPHGIAPALPHHVFRKQLLLVTYEDTHPQRALRIFAYARVASPRIGGFYFLYA